MRDIINEIFDQASSSRRRRMLPKDFPPVSTVRSYFYQWRESSSSAIACLGCGAYGTEVPTVLRVSSSLDPLGTDSEKNTMNQLKKEMV